MNSLVVLCSYIGEAIADAFMAIGDLIREKLTTHETTHNKPTKIERTKTFIKRIPKKISNSLH